jgi:uncharacterized membrane protein
MEEEPNAGNNDPTLEEVVRAAERLTPLFSMFMGRAAVQTEHDNLIQSRKQICSYVIIGGIVCLVAGLAYLGAIDRGAAACILGTVTGHIFCRAVSG